MFLNFYIYIVCIYTGTRGNFSRYKRMNLQQYACGVPYIAKTICNTNAKEIISKIFKIDLSFVKLIIASAHIKSLGVCK